MHVNRLQPGNSSVMPQSWNLHWAPPSGSLGHFQVSAVCGWLGYDIYIYIYYRYINVYIVFKYINEILNYIYIFNYIFILVWGSAKIKWIIIYVHIINVLTDRWKEHEGCRLINKTNPGWFNWMANEQILHHLGCTSPAKSKINYL